MKNYTYQNSLVSKKQLRQLLAWSFTTYNSMQSCSLADELKYLGFRYASHAGLSISIEDLRIPFIKGVIIEQASQDITNSEKLYLKGQITSVERFQKIIDTWNLTSESLKNQIVYFFKNYDPLNSVYIMAFSGARGNLSQVRQLVGMRGLMSDPSGEIMNLPIKKNFREGLTITDYLMSGYGARKGIVDTALKTANSGYLTRRLIDVSQDILIREKDCFTNYSILFSPNKYQSESNPQLFNKVIGCVLSKPLFDPETQSLVANAGTQITSDLIQVCKIQKIKKLEFRSPLTCNLYRAICQNCYGWDLATETLIDIGEAVGILAGQSIGEPGTQLTMRTFHTGGIFTSETQQRLFSPLSGIVQFYKAMKTVGFRTSRGEDVRVTKTSGFLTIIPTDKMIEPIRIPVSSNTILFPKNNQYVSRDTVIGEQINLNRQLRSEAKPILSDLDGEVIVPKLKQRVNLLNSNQLLWLLFGKLFYSPSMAFLNFYADHKINPHDCVSRSKLISHYEGTIISFERNTNNIKIVNLRYSLRHAQIKRLTAEIKNGTHLLNLQTSTYLVSIAKTNNKIYLKQTRTSQFGKLLTNKFRTPVGGLSFYDTQNSINSNSLAREIDYFYHDLDINYRQCINPTKHLTICWLNEEVHQIEGELDSLLINHGDFISEGFEIRPKLFSKTSGLVHIQQKSGIVQSISIKSGLVYEGKGFKTIKNKLYYPGEKILSDICTENLAICETFSEKNLDQLLIRSLDIYEIPKLSNSIVQTQNIANPLSLFKLLPKKLYSYSSGQLIQTERSLDLMIELIITKTQHFKMSSFNIEPVTNQTNNTIRLQVSQKLELTDYADPDLKYRGLRSCLLAQNHQFLSRYTTFGYLETVTDVPVEIVKVKVQQQTNKKILVISNADCTTVSKTKLPYKKLNDLVTTGPSVKHTGRIAIENKNTFIIQKGQPYFFPNCRNTTITTSSTLRYKILPNSYFTSFKNTSQIISKQYYDLGQISLRNMSPKNIVPGFQISGIINLSMFFLEKNAKLYTSVTPQFLTKFTLNKKNLNSNFQKLIVEKFDRLDNHKFQKREHAKNRTVLVKNLESLADSSKTYIHSNYQLSLLKLEEHPFQKSAKAVGLYSITEDYFEQKTNSVFCKNNEFIEAGTTIGLLNLEKEVTGDIVQGLPKIEEILEARKKNLGFRSVPTNQKKSLLCYASSLNPDFEFKKLGKPVKESGKINPHKLLKIYFNYYGLTRQFLCTRKKLIRYTRLTNNYEGSYRSFKKVQIFILNAVQTVYKSQGVTINNKHLEVIIKQMTTKTIITYEGDAPLLRREVIDLYHVEQVNKIIQFQKKEIACYAPLLLGITKSALNNPSFISAASFQETTRVLTKAAIEGRIDWLRGLKENIIIGHLIPAGTGSPNYRNTFRQKKQLSNHIGNLIRQNNQTA